jgi:hypothetical protein
MDQENRAPQPVLRQQLRRVMGFAFALAASAALAEAPAPSAEREALYQRTPCLREYRSYMLTWLTAEQFSIPPGLTLAQCQVAQRVNAELFADDEAEAARANAEAKKEEARRQAEIDESLRKSERDLSAWQAKAARTLARDRAAREALARKPGVRLGMTPAEVINASSWGRPLEIHRTITAGRTSEQWVYGLRSYLYFDSGRLTAIQN